MAGDLIREVRRAALAHLKGAPDVTDLIASESLYPSTTPPNPAWPFGRMDGFQSTAIDMSCVEGATVTFLLHGFAKPLMESGAMVDTAEDQASRIGSSFKVALHNRRLPVAGTTARFKVRSSRLLRDGAEEDAYHVVLSIEARVLAE